MIEFMEFLKFYRAFVNLSLRRQKVLFYLIINVNGIKKYVIKMKVYMEIKIILGSSSSYN